MSERIEIADRTEGVEFKDTVSVMAGDEAVVLATADLDVEENETALLSNPDIDGFVEANKSCVNSYFPYQTGQEVSYEADDDGDLQRGFGVDFFTLLENNPFGNTSRFTDTLGGQDYADDVVLNWAAYSEKDKVVLALHRSLVSGNWSTVKDSIKTATIAGRSGWFLPNVNEANAFSKYDQDNGLFNFSPLNFYQSGSGSRIWTVTTNPNITSRAAVLAESSSIGRDSKTNALQGIPFRYYTLTELGL